MLLNRGDVKTLHSTPPVWRWNDGAYSRSGNRGRARRNNTIRIGLLVPFSGSDAIWGPSCQYSAVLAAAMVNASGGVLGREIELFAANAGGPVSEVVDRVRGLVDDHYVDVLVGVHLSSVRVAIRNAFAHRIPYIFAPQYEGGECSPGVFTIGETPERQYRQAIEWMVKAMRARRWFLIGNDYIWPRESHRVVAKLIADSGGEIVGNEYLPFAQSDYDMNLKRIAEARPDVVFESLVGSDSVTFNQAFGETGMSGRIARLSGAIEENTLMGICEENSHNLFCVSGYFNALKTAENKTFLDEYRKAFGETAPVQGALSQSCYESVLFFSALAKQAGSFNIDDLIHTGRNLTYFGARGRVCISDGRAEMACYLAQSGGIDYELIRSFPAN